MPEAMQKIVDILPLTQGIKFLKATSLGFPIENTFVPMTVMVYLPSFVSEYPFAFSNGSSK